MTLTISNKDFLVFDLDDTLFKEVDYLKSAYRYIVEILKPELGINVYDEMWAWYCNKEITFDKLKEKYSFSMTIEQMVYNYRYHLPDINLSDEINRLLINLKNNPIKIGLLTDGRSTTQRNKLKSLGLQNSFDHIVISEEIGSEKPSQKNYMSFMEKYPGFTFIYFADNPSKDFITANKLGWKTICLLDDGQNIHKQDFELPVEFLPQLKLDSFSNLNLNIL